jgi:hypothetical protein
MVFGVLRLVYSNSEKDHRLEQIRLPVEDRTEFRGFWEWGGWMALWIWAFVYCAMAGLLRGSSLD